jgi:two-component system, NarL family, nitrate/nitrite response regulator NarL
MPPVTILQRFLRLLGLSRPPHLNLEVDQDLIHSLEELAQREQRAQKELAVELLSMALVQRDAAEIYLRCWGSLSRREQQVTALICLGYTNRQMATRLVLSQETVKTHVRNVLQKFKLRNRSELRHALADWDFGAWESLIE